MNKEPGEQKKETELREECEEQLTGIEEDLSYQGAWKAMHIRAFIDHLIADREAHGRAAWEAGFKQGIDYADQCAASSNAWLVKIPTHAQWSEQQRDHVADASKMVRCNVCNKNVAWRCIDGPPTATYNGIPLFSCPNAPDGINRVNTVSEKQREGCKECGAGPLDTHSALCMMGEEES